MVARRTSVVKVGGSVLTGRLAYRRVAAYIADRLRSRPEEGLVAVVSAVNGATDALLATARDIVPEPDEATVDLLCSTGETHSAAVLALHLQARGVRATAANVHQTGLVDPELGGGAGRSWLRPLRLLALLDAYDVVVAPGFLARGAGDRIVSLGRGGSDLTAVLLAAGLDAARCELVKDVPGYFTTDPRRDPHARPVLHLTYARAIEMADDGCTLVQRHALIAARDCALPLVIRALSGEHETVVSASTSHLCT
jgi:aspartate kinase